MRTTTVSLSQMSERANMEVDVLVLCAEQHNNEDILATIEDELLDEPAMSELAITDSATFDESRPDDGDVCQCVDDPVTSSDERMLTPDDDPSGGGVAPTTDNIEPFDDECAGLADACVSPATLSHTARSDSVETQEEETFPDSTLVDRRNSTDCACSYDSVTAVDCVVGNTSHDECDPSAPVDDDLSKTACSVTDHYNHAETVSDTISPQSGHSETPSVSRAETTSSVSVIDTFAVVDSSDVIVDVDSALIVTKPDTDSAGNVNASCFTNAASADDTQQTSGLSAEAIALELAEAVDLETKKKGFRVRFHDDHVTGYLDPPTPWREGWLHVSAVSYNTNSMTLDDFTFWVSLSLSPRFGLSES